MENDAFHHITVLRDEAVDQLITEPNGTYVDCTLGGAGHSSLILERLSDKGRLIGFDQDPKAIFHARERLGKDGRFQSVNSNFICLEEKLREIGVCPVHGVLFDLGVSSPQLDEAERGFSYMQNAQLDMRMDPENPLTAQDIVNCWSEDEITRTIREYGEENWAKRIAQFIVQARTQKPITYTSELVEIIKEAIPAAARRNGPHPAKRTFQALRIAVNNELGVLEGALDQALNCLEPGGRIAVITFHSLEDRIIKEKMQRWLGRCTCPPDFPVCICNVQPTARLITRRPILPSKREVGENPRARSAKLRVAEKL